MKYTIKEYKKYCKKIDKKIGKPIDYKRWKLFQPVADKITGKVNKIINKI